MSTDCRQMAVSPFSGTVASQVWGHRDGKWIYRCPDTGAMFFDRNALEPETYADYYPYLSGWDHERFQRELRIRRPKYTRQLRTMVKYVDGRRLLDIGAGPGYFCRIAQDEGWSAEGVEISSEAVRFGTAKFGVVYRILDDVPSESVNAISCHHVLEHIEKPMEFLSTLRSKLAPGGLLVLHVPHQMPLSFAIRDMLGRMTFKRSDTFCSLYGNIHISGFTKNSLKCVIERAGFKTHFVRTAGMWTKYYDPFFFRSYAEQGKWRQILKKTLRHAVDSAAAVISSGDWVVGYFLKPRK